MTEMQCVGYYLVKPRVKPDWCTIKSKKILSVSENGLSDKFPDLTKCFWINYPRSHREEYAGYLGLNPREFSEFCQHVSDLFNGKRLTVDIRFSTLEDALMLSQYLRNVSGYRIVGVYTESSTFSEVKAEDDHQGKYIGCEILGSQMVEYGIDAFDSYLINSLNEVLDTDLMIDAQTGLILNSYEETKQFCNKIQGMGEPVIWRPFVLMEFTGGRNGSAY